MIEIQRKIFITATLLGLVGVVLGAFAAHGLRSELPDSALESFQTGVRYQMYHAFFLFFIVLNSHLSSAQKKYILGLTLVGIILFSLSIYLLATNAMTSIDFSFWFYSKYWLFIKLVRWNIKFRYFLAIDK